MFTLLYKNHNQINISKTSCRGYVVVQNNKKPKFSIPCEKTSRYRHFTAFTI